MTHEQYYVSQEREREKYRRKQVLDVVTSIIDGSEFLSIIADISFLLNFIFIFYNKKK